MKSFESLLSRRKSELKRLPSTHNITVDGYECLAKATSPKNMIKLADLVDMPGRISRANSIHNLVETCRNSNNKHLRFEDLVLKPHLTQEK